jgi:hypothetical protein
MPSGIIEIFGWKIGSLGKITNARRAKTPGPGKEQAADGRSRK